MTPRARKATDDEVYCAVALLTSRLGPDRMTLDDIAREVGVTPSALVQRFGSKREMLLAAVRAWNESDEDPATALRGTRATALDTLYAYAECVADMVADPEVTANQLAMLQLDVRDPEFRAEAARFFRGELATLRAWVEEAVAEGSLGRGTDAARLGAAIQAALAGWRILWAIVRDGEARDAARAVLHALLEPHLPGGRGVAEHADARGAG